MVQRVHVKSHRRAELFLRILPTNIISSLEYQMISYPGVPFIGSKLIRIETIFFASLDILTVFVSVLRIKSIC